MSVRGGSPEPALAAQLRLGQGFHEADRAQVLTELSSLGRHLAHWSPDRVDLEVSVKDRGGPQQMVTLEAWLPGWPSQVAHSAAADLRPCPGRGAAGDDPPHRGRESQAAPTLITRGSTP